MVDSNPQTNDVSALMKKLFAFPLLAALALFAGCTTVGAPDIERISRAVQEAARIGTQEAVRDHPEWIPYFVTTRDSLNILAASDKLTVASLLEAISKLPVSELSSDTARLIIAGAVLTVSIAGWSDIEIVQTEQIRPVVIALSDGINAGLTTQPSAVRIPAVAKAHYKAK